MLPLTPAEGWNLDNLPTNLPHHTELIRGALVMNRQTPWHSRVVDMLAEPLQEQCPHEFMVLRGMAIRRSPRTAPEPDISLVRASEHRLVGGGYHRMRTATGRFATDTPFPLDIPLGAPLR